MGVDTNFYVGPYLVINIPLVNGIEQPEVNWEELYYKGNFSDYLYSTSFMGPPKIINNKRRYIYLPNRYSLELGVISVDQSYDDCDEKINLDYVKDSISIFQSKFKDELAYVSSLFKDIEINFGFVCYHS